MQELEIRQFLPIIARARGYRLYDTRGQRYLDLYQNGGASLLGHRGANLTRVMKNLISRGQIMDMPSVYETRLIKALEKQFPGYAFRLHSGWYEVQEEISRFLGRPFSPREVEDPAREEPRGDVAYWRPFLKTPETKVLIPLLPLAVGGIPMAAGYKGEKKEAHPRGISPFLLAGALRGFYDIRKQTVPRWSESFKVDEQLWQKNGIYLTPLMEKHEYEKTFRLFLEENVLLSPEYKSPSILPGECSPGELKKLEKLFYGKNNAAE